MSHPLPSQEYRQSFYRTIRRQVLVLDPQSDFLTFGKGVLESLVTNLKAGGCGVVVHFRDSTRDLVLFRESTGNISRSVTSFREPSSRLEDLDAWDHPEVARLAGSSGFQPQRVLRVPIKVRDEVLATMEIGDPDGEIAPNAAALGTVAMDLAPVFELTFLYSRVRQEQLESDLLSRVSKALGTTLDLESLMDSILTLLHQVVPYDAAGIFLLNVGEELGPVRQSIRGYPEGSEHLLHMKLGQGIVGWTAQTGEPQIVGDVKADKRYVMAREETSSEMVAPLTSGGRILGVFNLENNRPAAYSQHDLELLMRFGAQAAVALERARLLREEEAARRLEQQVEIAGRIQQAFLPKLSEDLIARGFSGHTRPSLEVSGDYYDLVPLSGGDYAIAIADVCGKGIPASLIMSTLRAAFHMEIHHSEDPAEWCRDLNALLVPSLRETEFITACFAVLSKDQSTLRYANAGHNPPFVLRQDGRVEFLDVGGTILGSFAGVPYESAYVTLEEGDRVVFYTDGVTEAFGANEEEFGTDRLVETVRSLGFEATSQEVQEAIVRSVLEFSVEELMDDLTVVVVSGPS